MSFCLFPASFFSSMDIPDGKLDQRDFRRLQQIDAEFILSNNVDLGFWVSACLENCSYDDMLRIYRSDSCKPHPSFAWIMCSPNPLRAFEKLSDWDARLHPQHYADYDGDYFRLDIRQLCNGQKSLEFGVITIVALYVEVLSDSRLICMRLPHEMQELALYLRRTFDIQVQPSDGDVLFEVPLSSVEEITMQSYNPYLESLLPIRPSMVTLSRETDSLNEIRGILRNTIAQRDFSLSDLADHLGSSRRTVQRRLASGGTSFSSLRDEIRIELVQDEISGRSNVDDLVEKLGFRDVSAVYKLKRRVETRWE